MSVIGRASPFLAGGDFAFAITGSTADANLRTLALAAGWNGSAPVVCTINGGVQVYSSAGGVAMTVNGSFPGGVTLINNGVIYGTGGTGGNGGTAVIGNFGGSGSGGNNGGAGLAIYVPLKLTNNGSIWGCGGGGGGGGSCNNSAHTEGYNGGTGGTGAQYPSNSATAGGASTSTGYGSNKGGDGGSITSNGSAGDTPTGDYFALGGNGGSYGNAIGGTSQLTGGSTTGTYYGNTAA